MVVVEEEVGQGRMLAMAQISPLYQVISISNRISLVRADRQEHSTRGDSLQNARLGHVFTFQNKLNRRQMIQKQDSSCQIPYCGPSNV